MTYLRLLNRRELELVHNCGKLLTFASVRSTWMRFQLTESYPNTGQITLNSILRSKTQEHKRIRKWNFANKWQRRRRNSQISSRTTKKRRRRRKRKVKVMASRRSNMLSLPLEIWKLLTWWRKHMKSVVAIEGVPCASDLYAARRRIKHWGRSISSKSGSKLLMHVNLTTSFGVISVIQASIEISWRHSTGSLQ